MYSLVFLYQSTIFLEKKFPAILYIAEILSTLPILDMTTFAMMYMSVLLLVNINHLITVIFKSIKKEVSLGYSRSFVSLILLSVLCVFIRPFQGFALNCYFSNTL